MILRAVRAIAVIFAARRGVAEFLLKIWGLAMAIVKKDGAHVDVEDLKNSARSNLWAAIISFSLSSLG